MNACVVQILPMRGLAVLAVTNRGGDRAKKAALEATLAIIRLHDKQ